MSKIIVIRKNVRGGLHLQLENINDINQTRTLVFDDRRPTHRIGIDFALSIFTEPVLFEMYRKGMFVIENEQDFYAQAEAEGVYYNFDEKKKGDSIERTVMDMEYVPENKILESLKSRNSVALRKNLEDASAYLKSQYLYVATDNIKEISTGNIQIIEDVLQTILAKDNSEE